MYSSRETNADQMFGDRQFLVGIFQDVTVLYSTRTTIVIDKKGAHPPELPSLALDAGT
jgi:hypothetical protein